MRLNEELEPKLDIAEKIYPKVLSILSDYEDFVDQNGDEDDSEYKRVQAQLERMTGKDLSEYNLYESWEEEGLEVLAFRISLPIPVKVSKISYDDVFEIVKRLKTFNSYDDNGSFAEQFEYYLSDYYYELLELNLPKYDQDYFLRQKNGVEYTVEEIVNKII